ncbi:MAG: NAD-binding protein [Planctomycetaceae bacterium]|nr:NAD-binding protein [Planctomycetales bacterium]MCB9873082.1 NAD-binding protein [Planctomycetaceae bacterium]MCB9937764.1 NAD-binding protein [Planctomycetaceae bacterium]HRX77806.1 potassium channel protein [Pirellulaceae bacterium]
MLHSTRSTRISLASEELRAATRCVAILLTVVVFGTLGFWYIEHENNWDLWKSLFFTLITITTVGYGDQGLSPTGEKFAAILLLFGIGSATYSITSLVQIAVTYQSTRKQKMQNKIDRLQDHLIICGFGRIGRTVADELAKANVPFVVVDCEPRIVEEALDHNFLAVQGNSTDDEVLHQAGIDRAKGIICATSSDAENVFVTLCAHELNADAFIACRASNDSAARRMERAGATLVVSPYTTAGHNIADAILRPKHAQFLHSNRSGNIELGEFRIEEGSSLVGETVRSIGERLHTVVFVAVRSQDAKVPTRPGGNQSFSAGDAVTVAGPRDDLERLYLEAEGVVELANC